MDPHRPARAAIADEMCEAWKPARFGARTVLHEPRADEGAVPRTGRDALVGNPGWKPRAADARLYAAGKPAEGGLPLDVGLAAFPSGGSVYRMPSCAGAHAGEPAPRRAWPLRRPLIFAALGFQPGVSEALDGLFTDVLGVLLHRRLLSLDLVAQDGTRIRASATAPSFRREKSLEECREQAALHLRAVLLEADDPEATAAERAARLAAARDYQRRVDEALETVKQLQGEGKEAPHWGTPGRGPGQQNHDCTWGPSPPGAGSRSASGWPRSPRVAPCSVCRAPRRLALGSPP